jgi:peptidoglycan biosynthesis protein MviN/MurJ (putative lipid II flippase)
MMNIFTDRIIRAAKFDVNLYEEVEADKDAMPQAMGVVVLSSLASGVGSIGTLGLGGILLGTLAALGGWYIWAWFTYFIGTRFLAEPQTEADLGQLLRTTVVFAVASIWMLVAMVIAVRQALDYTSTFRAVGVCVIGWIIQTVILLLLFSLLGGPPSP